MSKYDKMRISDFLKHILISIDYIKKHTQNISECIFLESDLVQIAVIRDIELIGEACRNIKNNHPEFMLEHPEIPWEDLCYLRNKLTDNCFTIDWEIVWNTIHLDLPDLERKIKQILSV
jgi:uncharacterized protein with HEPN domain